MKLTRFIAPNRTDAIRLEEYASLGDLWPLFANHHVYEHETADGKTPNGRNRDVTGYTPPGMAAFSPAEYDGTQKQNEVTGNWSYCTDDKNVVRIHFGVLDFDKISPAKFAVVLDRFKTVNKIVYSTYSHGRTGGVGSYRLVFPFDRPVEAREWAHCWAGMSTMVDNWNDDKCFDPRRLYYFPCSVRGREQWRSSTITGGQALNVNALIQIGAQAIKIAQNSPLIQHERPQVTSVGLSDILDMCSDLRRRKSEHHKEMGRRIRDALAGKTFYAMPGDRDVWLFQLAGHLAESFPRGDPLSMADHFRQMLARACAGYQSGDPNEDFAKLVDKIVRQQQNYIAKRSAEQATQEDSKRFRIREAFQAVGVDRDFQYTPDDLKKYADFSGVSVTDFKTRLVLQYGTSHYTFVDGHYMKPLGEASFSVSSIRDLSPHPDVEVLNSKGKAKTPKDIVQDYGTVARNAIIDLTAVRTTYDPISQTIVEASCPVRELPAERSPLVETWLKFLGGDKVELLLDWISVITRLDRPATILYLCGPKGIGKSSFSDGLAKLWVKDGGATPMGLAFSKFRGTLAECPLVVADEELPPELKSRPSTALRGFMAETTRKIERKFLADVSCVGAVRVILSANNPNLLQTEESLTTDDLDALTQRLLFIRPDPQAEQFMAALAAAGIDFKKHIIEEGGLAKHALWLKETRAASADNGRFFVHDVVDNELTRGLASTVGVQSAICHWIVSYLQRPNLYEDQNTGLAIRQGGNLYISAQAVHDAWSLYMVSHRQPTAQRIGSGLQGLSDGPARIIPQKSHSAAYFPVRVELLVHWAQTHGFSSEQEIRQALMRETKISDIDKAAVQLYNTDNMVRRAQKNKEAQVGIFYRQTKLGA